MKIDFESAVKFPFNFPSQKDMLLTFLIAAVLCFVESFSFNFRSSVRSPGASDAMDQLVSSFKGFIDFLSAQGFLIPFVILTSILVLIILILKISCSSLNNGYIVETVKIETGDNMPFMPLWRGNYKRFFITGLKLWVIKFIYALIYLGIPVALMIYLFCINWNTFFSANSDAEILKIIFSPQMIILFIFSVLSMLAFAIIEPAIVYIFSKQQTILSGFNLLEVFSLIYNNIFDYIIAFFVRIGLILLLIPINIGLCCTCVGIFFIPLVNTFIYRIISLNIFIQAIKD